MNTKVKCPECGGELLYDRTMFSLVEGHKVDILDCRFCGKAWSIGQDKTLKLIGGRSVG